MALTLLRHGALARKHQGRYNGWTNLSIDPALFDTSKITLLQEQAFDLVYSSDLLRCQQTIQRLGFTDYQIDARLREVRFKPKIEGLNFDELCTLDDYHEDHLKTSQAWHAYICQESLQDFEARVQALVESLPRNKNILICSHAGTLKQILHTLGYKRKTLGYLDSIRIE